MRVLKPILLLACILVVPRCGLPDQYYIQAPTQGVTPAGTGQQFSFSNPDHTKDLNITFKGYEIYYQLYAPNSSININPYDPNNTTSVDGQLTAAGYKLATLSTDQPPNRTDPVIPVGISDVGTPFTVTIIVNPQASPPAQFVTTLPSLLFGNIRRAVVDMRSGLNNSLYKDFSTNLGNAGNYQVGDADISATITPTSDPIWIAMFAVSYGLIGVSSPQRSVPTYLGYISLSVNQ